MARARAGSLIIGMALAWALPAAAQPGASEVRYAPAPDWLKPEPPALDRKVTSGAVEVIYNDTQVRVSGDVTQTYAAYRVRLITSEALALGNINLAWNPDVGGVTVHRLLIHRGDETIDVLKDAKFSVFQREGRLEQAMLDGMLTANLQIPGLRIGDELEFAFTTEETKQPFPGHVFGALAASPDLAPGTYRMALDWPKDQALRWQASKDLEPVLAKRPDGIVATLTDPPKIVFPAAAPPRYTVSRFIEYTGFSSWSALSSQEAAMFARAAVLPPDPALQKEIDRIAALGPDPQQRALAALVLVQDSIRYVFAGMDGGNYRPATVAQTWDRRFGDCKGKTAMLLGILDKLGIPAEAVLVNTLGGDGLDERLPSPALFDHVLVRTVIAGKRYWLDGTRAGEGRLLTDADVGYRWVLPLSPKGSEPEALSYIPPAQPKDLTLVDIDARAGLQAKAQVTVTTVLRGDAALLLNQALRAMAKDTAEATLRQQAADGWIDPQSAEWSYDTKTGAMVMTVKAQADIDWETQSDTTPATVSYYLPGGGFYKPAKLERPTGQDKSVPYANERGRFSCSVTHMRLPAPAKGQHWSLTAPPIDRLIGGIAYYRTSKLDHGVVDLVRSSRTVDAELSPFQAIAADRLIPGFDDNKAWVASENDSPDAADPGAKDLPDVAGIDWAKDASLCRSPARP